MSDDLSEYLRAKEPEKAELAGIWRAAIGLQKVDGLTPSAYLVETARRNIEGEISIAEAGKIIGEYYKSKAVRAEAAKTRTDEADIVSQHMTEILAEPTFSFSPEQLVSIHRRLFEGIYKHAGRIRDYNITKNEWVLKGDTVKYASYFRLVETIAFDFAEEKKFSYASISMDEVIRHFSKFIAGIWQIHPFGEGNTRTTSVFAIKYLRTLGFDVNNDIFYDNSYYFRNALVRANYSNIPRGIEETTEYLERFFHNALMGEENKLQSRYLLVGGWQEDATHASSENTPTSKPAATPASNGGALASRVMALSRAVRRLIDVLEGEMSRAKIMKAIGIKDRVTFADYYLAPALKLGLVEMTQPNSPRSPTQKYRLTVKGRNVRMEVGK
jgi:fido (protein-threonine AMPylation protein)